jgi:hypothetical protein
MYLHHALLKGFSTRFPRLLLTAALPLLLVSTGCSQLPRATQSNAQSSTINAINTAEISALEIQSQQDPNNAELLYKLSLAYIVDAEKNKSPESRDLAIRSLRKVLRLVPGNNATLRLLYNIYYEDVVAGKDKAFAKATGIFNQLPPTTRSEVNAPSLGLFLNRYFAQQKSGKKNPSELYPPLLDAINEQPNSDKAYIQLAKMYREENYYPLALATLKLGKEEITASKGLYEAIANTYEARAEASGCSYEKSSYINDAIHYYQQAVPLAPNDTSIHFALSRLYLDQNLHQLALNESSILMELDPSAENIVFSAQNYSVVGNNQKAHLLLEQAKGKGLDNSDSAYHEIYMNSGDWMKAALSYSAYVETKKNITVYDFIKADIISQQTDMGFSTPQKPLVFNSEWESTVYAYWMGETTSTELAQAATNRCERTEYFFYSGYRDYRSGKTSAAKANFSAALEQNTYRFIERPLARYFLQAINAR